jgi:hypothetical protein
MNNNRIRRDINNNYDDDNNNNNDNNTVPENSPKRYENPFSMQLSTPTWASTVFKARKTRTDF